jgi:hypothetical protein
MMTPAKQRQLIEGQTAIATKVYDCVPIREAWSIARICTELSATTSTRPDMRVVRGCLERLKDSNLVREIERDTWQRVPTREKETTPMPEPRPTLTLAKPPATTEPIDLLAGIAQRMRELGSLANAIADDIDTAAIAIAEHEAENTGNLDKLRQLQSLLKSLSIA